MKKISLGVNKLWETVVYYTQFDDISLRDELAKDVIENLNLYPENSVEINDYSIFNLKRKIINKFKKNVVLPTFYEYLEILNVDIKNYKFSFTGWLTGQGPNYNLNYHNHKGASISAIFYPFIGEKNNSFGGEVIFHDPRMNANRGYVNNFDILFDPKIFTPSTGDIIIFPSFLYHHVNTYFSSMRIGIAVDGFILKENEK